MKKGYVIFTTKIRTGLYRILVQDTLHGWATILDEQVHADNNGKARTIAKNKLRAEARGSNEQ